MPRSALFAVVAAVPLAAAVWLAGQEAPEPAQQRVSPEVLEKLESLVGRLGGSERADRVAAEKELLDYGPWVLPHLPEPSEVSDPAARAGLDRVRKRLEEMEAAESIRATVVTTTINSPTLGELRFNLDRGSVAPFALSPDQSLRPIEIDRRDQPYWPVVDDLASQTGLWPDRVNGMGISLRERTPEDDAKRVAYKEAFRFAAGPLSLKPVAGNAARRLVRVPVEVRAEPKLRPLFLSYAASDMDLEASDGTQLPAFTPDAKVEVPLGKRGDAAELRLDFTTSTAPLAGPVMLTGKIGVTLAAAEENFTFSLEDGSPRDARQGGVTVRLRNVARTPDGAVEIEVAVVYDRGGPAFESHRSWIFRHAVSLLYQTTQDGQPSYDWGRPDPDFSMTVERDGGRAMRYRFSGVPANAKLLHGACTVPTKIVEVPVEFEIDGLTVPAGVSAGSAAGP